MLEKPIKKQLLELADKKIFLRPADLRALGIPDFYLRQLTQQGILRRIRHGLYCRADKSFGQYETYIEVTQRIPQGVVTLLSALELHGVGTQAPWEIWLAVGQKQHPPKTAALPVRLVWYSGAALTEGVETHSLFGVPVKVYNLEKTIADCFKYRNKIGVEVAIEALKESWQKKKIRADKLRHYAEICRVHKVISPYMETLV